MATGDNPVIPLFEPGTRPTGAVTAAVVAGTFLKSSGDFQGGPNLNVSSPITGGNLMQVATCTAGAKAIGVAGWDCAASGDVVAIIGADIIVPMVTGAAITAGQEVESNGTGQPIPLASGKACGYCVSGAGSAGTAWIKIY